MYADLYSGNDCVKAAKLLQNTRRTSTSSSGEPTVPKPHTGCQHAQRKKRVQPTRLQLKKLKPLTAGNEENVRCARNQVKLSVPWHRAPSPDRQEVASCSTAFGSTLPEHHQAHAPCNAQHMSIGHP
mmetsp:Transcript_114182/g.209818  ORF Transcript_114182/g.209818 Transcript_114182/m.209818 type:complete len:127 (-) Transcript_114182:1512-1892(-)